MGRVPQWTQYNQEGPQKWKRKRAEGDATTEEISDVTKTQLTITDGETGKRK